MVYPDVLRALQCDVVTSGSVAVVCSCSYQCQVAENDVAAAAEVENTCCLVAERSCQCYAWQCEQRVVASCAFDDRRHIETLCNDINTITVFHCRGKLRLVRDESH